MMPGSVNASNICLCHPNSRRCPDRLAYSLERVKFCSAHSLNDCLAGGRQRESR